MAHLSGLTSSRITLRDAGKVADFPAVNIATEGLASTLQRPTGVKQPIRLDAVVKVKEREEKRALKQLAHAQDAARQARLAAEAVRKKLLEEIRAPGRVDFWEMAELAIDRSRFELKKAEEKASQADNEMHKARAEHLVARNKAEAVRRVAENRRTEMILESERKETNRLDEIAAVKFWYRSE